jgi:hypothetical protein
MNASFSWQLGSMLVALAAVWLDDASKYLIEREGRHELKATVMLQEEQGGFAGINVSCWTIKPCGEWSYSEYQIVGGKERPDSRRTKTGKLSDKELQQLAKQLAAQNLAGLPRAVGQAAPVNPHRYTLRFGKEVESTVLGAEPRNDNEIKKNILTARVHEEAATAAQARFAAIAQAIVDQTKGR